MKTEENLDQLFALLKSENATTSPVEISMWLGTASIVTTSAKVPLLLKFKALLMSKTGWIILLTIISIAGISAYLSFWSNSKKGTNKKSETHYFVQEPLKRSDAVQLNMWKGTKTDLEVKTDVKRTISEADQSFLQLKPTAIHPISLQKGIPVQNLNPSDTLKAMQNWAGVYKNYDDFIKGKYCDSILVNVGKNKIYVSSFDRLIIKTESRKTIYKLGSVYGFYDGKKLRRYGETTSALKDYGYFTVQETDGLILYSQIQTGYKGTQHTYFFFSTALNTQIKILSTKNLKLDFSNDEFIGEVSKKVDRLTNMGTEKWEVALKEINEVYRKYYR